MRGCQQHGQHSPQATMVWWCQRNSGRCSSARTCWAAAWRPAWWTSCCGNARSMRSTAASGRCASMLWTPWEHWLQPCRQPLQHLLSSCVSCECSISHKSKTALKGSHASWLEAACKGVDQTWQRDLQETRETFAELRAEAMSMLPVE